MTLDEEVIDAATPSGPMRVYVYRPAGGSSRAHPGLVLYSEIYQQTGPIKRSALRFASHGYVVAVPEVFHEHEPLGTVLAYDQEGTARGNQYKYGTALSTFDADIDCVLKVLSGHPACDGSLGAVGFCMGGHLAYRAAMDPRVLATACFYATDIHSDTLGRDKKSDSLARTSEIRGELMMLWGRQDPHISEDGRALVRARLREAGTNVTWHEFNAAHAFMRDEGPRYDPALATLGYALALEMFDRRLRG